MYGDDDPAAPAPAKTGTVVINPLPAGIDVAWGPFDMHGNARKCVLDGYKSDYEAYPEEGIR